MTIAKALRQEQQLADAIVKVVQTPEGDRHMSDILDHVRVETASLWVARAVYEELGIRSAYDTLLENSIEDARIEQMIAKQHPKAAEAVQKLRIEFAGLPVDGLKALRMLIDSTIGEKGG